MARPALGEILQMIRCACAGRGTCELTDRELLGRYVANQNQDAFAHLVKRHGPMVLGVSRRVLGACHEVEDVFQATFLVLVRRAGSIKRGQSVGSWLYGVAQRLALRVRTQEAARRRREREAPRMRCERVRDELSLPELRSVLDEEMGHLPEKYRSPLVFCYLEGHSYEQAARELGCPKSTVAKRVGRACELLRRKLERRGITLTAAALTTALAEMGSAAPLPAMLTIKTIKAAALVAAGKSVAGCVSAGALALVEEAVAGMLGAKVKLALMLLAFGLAVGGAGLAAIAGSGKAEPVPPARTLIAKEAAKEEPGTDEYGDPLPGGAFRRLGTVRLRHDSHVTGVAYSPDGKILASGSHDQTIRLWDPNTGKLIRELRVPVGDHILCIAFSPDGSKLASGLRGKSVRVWDVRTGKMIFEKQGHEEDVAGIAFAPDGQTFASSGGNIRVWSATTGAEILNLQPPGRNRSWRRGVAYSPDGTLLAASRGHDIYVWNAATGAARLVIPKAYPFKAYQRGDIFTIFLDNHTLISSESGHVRFWDVTSGKQIREFVPQDINPFGGIALSRNGKLLAMAGRDKIDILNASTGKSIQVLSEYYNSFSATTNHLAFSPDSATLAAKAGDNGVRVWDIRTGERRLAFDDAHTGRVRSAAFSPSGSRVLTAGDEGTVRLWDVATGKQLRVLQGNNQERGVRGETVAAWSSDGKWIAAGGYEHTPKQSFAGSCRVWEAATGKLLHVQGFPFRVQRLAFAPNGEELAIAMDESDSFRKNTVYHWAFLKGKEPTKVAEQVEWLNALAFSADGKTLALVALGSLLLWDKATKKQQGTINLPEGARFSTVSPDIKKVVTSEWDSDRLFVTEAATGRLLRTIKSPNTQGNIAAISSDGRIMVSCQMTYEPPDREYDYSIRLWEIETGKQVLQFPLSPSAVGTLAFSGDGHALISGMNNGTALIWSMKPKLAKALLPRHLESLWRDLADDAAKAHEAIWTFVAAPEQALPFLRKQLGPVIPIDAHKLRQWIADVDSETFSVRQAAAKELGKIGPQATAQIKNAMKGSITLEARRRLEQILNSFSDIPAPETLRNIRAIMALERIGSRDAQAVLATLAGGAPGARETEEAKASLERLKPRVFGNK